MIKKLMVGQVGRLGRKGLTKAIGWGAASKSKKLAKLAGGALAKRIKKK